MKATIPFLAIGLVNPILATAIGGQDFPSTHWLLSVLVLDVFAVLLIYVARWSKHVRPPCGLPDQD